MARAQWVPGLQAPSNLAGSMIKNTHFFPLLILSQRYDIKYCTHLSSRECATPKPLLSWLKHHHRWSKRSRSWMMRSGKRSTMSSESSKDSSTTFLPLKRSPRTSPWTSTQCCSPPSSPPNRSSRGRKRLSLPTLRQPPSQRPGRLRRPSVRKPSTRMPLTRTGGTSTRRREPCRSSSARRRRRGRSLMP